MSAPSPKLILKIAAPDLPSELPTPMLLEDLKNDRHVSEIALSDWNQMGKSGSGITFDSLILDRANLSSTTLRGLRIRDARLLRPDLSNANWSPSTLERVEILDGRLTGLKALEASFQDVSFVRCKADLAQFRHASLRDCRFEDCILRDADFYGAELRGVSFRGSDLKGANFNGTKLAQADFRGVRLDELFLQQADFKGMIIDAAQAMELSLVFAQALGLQVID